ncbi:MAG: hypothetical protein K6T29_01385 [Peptococcaceae bacterium]|nr:hypothetical protein [Peptococcaceae bacterium]
MGVLAGRFPGRAREGFFEQKRKRLADAVRDFIAFAENYGVAVVEREADFWREARGKKIAEGLENYGVAACDKGTDFWKGGR